MAKIASDVLLDRIEQEMHGGGYQPPHALFGKFNPIIELDRRYLDYILGGGKGGGYYHCLPADALSAVSTHPGAW